MSHDTAPGLYEEWVRSNPEALDFQVNRAALVDPAVLDMFQFVVFGWEVVKAYSELVDPIEQRTRLEEQMAMREAGDDETMMLEEDFIEAMEYGMPPQSGLGLGIDRFVALLTNAHTLRDVVFFPQMRDSRGTSATPAE